MVRNLGNLLFLNLNERDFGRDPLLTKPFFSDLGRYDASPGCCKRTWLFLGIEAQNTYG